MSNEPGSSSPWPSGVRQFVTTQWSLVFSARDAEDTVAAEALETLCRDYWAPLYSFIRWQGYAPAEAQDLTQEFFARLLERNYLSRLEHRNGRFRSFLLTFLKNFLLEQRGRAQAQKRGGGKTIVSIEELAEADQHVSGLSAQLTPDQIYERRWAETVLQQALAQLRTEYEDHGQGKLFATLKDFQPYDPHGPSQQQLAEKLGMTEAAVKSAVKRMRQRHRELIRAQIAQTVAEPAEIEDEMRYLRSVLERSSA
jgi:RNA polymerase sigma-70 factor (ECF subfamily)